MHDGGVECKEEEPSRSGRIEAAAYQEAYQEVHTTNDVL